MEAGSMIDILFAHPAFLIYGSIAAFLTLCIFFFRRHGIPWYRKLPFAIARALLIILLFIAIADPLVMQETAARQGGSLTILYDNSTSMELFDTNPDQIRDDISNQMPVALRVIAEQDASPLISTISSELTPFGQYLLISDGRATDGDSFEEVVKQAISLNATINTLKIDEAYADAGVSIIGPKKTVVAATNTYDIRITNPTGIRGKLTVTIDGKTALETGDITSSHSITHTFMETIPHTIQATLELSDDDHFEENNAYYMTTRVLPRPKIAYVGSNTRFVTFMREIFDVERFDTSFPHSLDGYNAVIVHNRNANQIDATLLEEFVSNGGGLALIGGGSAYDFGNYDTSAFAPLIPVKSGSTGGQNRAAVVIAVDISGSTSSRFDEGSNSIVTDVEKSLAYDITKSLGNENLLGVIAFNTEAYLVSDLTVLGRGRQAILDKISRMEHSGGTRLHVGLNAAHKLLKDTTGSRAVIFISDGQAGGDNDGGKASAIAERMKKENIQLFTIGVGEKTKEAVMRGLARVGGGLYLRPQETERLQIQFGKTRGALGYDDTFTISIFDDDHIITQGLSNAQSTLNNVNRVVPKAGARPLMMTSQGDVALTVWNYGLGRVASWTAYTGTEDLGNMLSAEDSLLIMRFLTWVAGDPEAVNPPPLIIEDGYLGAPSQVRAHASSYETLAEGLSTTPELLKDELDLIKTDTETFKGSISKPSPGFYQVFGHTFAVNAPEEFEVMGQATSIEQLALYTKGTFLNDTNGNDLVAQTRSNLAHSVSPVPYAWLVLVAALALFTLEIVVRKTFERFFE
jgi:Mg-chelatase subunit ChlD/uncharacterized membrane protein